MKLSALPPARGRNEMYLANDGAADELSIDEVAIIFSFITHVDIMHARVCTAWREAAKKTLVPLSNFYVNSAAQILQRHANTKPAEDFA